MAKRRKKKSLIPLLLILILAVGCVSSYIYYSQSIKAVSETSEEVEFKVNIGDTSADILQHLKNENLIKEQDILSKEYERILKQTEYAKRIAKAGKDAMYDKVEISVNENGIQDGITKNFDENGKFYSTVYYEKNSNLTKWQFFYEDEKSIKKEGMAYDMGDKVEKRWKIIGEWKYYNKEGKLEMIETYENNEIVKVEEF